jgi:rod shape-determining protein MreC
MREFLHSWKFKIIVCIFALLIGFMIYAAAAAGAASLPERALRSVTAPFSRLSTSISTFITGNIDTIVNANRYKEENDELRQTISDLNQQIVDIDELKTDNALLRDMLEITEENPDFEWPSNTCRIIARNPNDVFGGFTINRGSEDGIGLHDLVITKIGVAGIITKVYPNHANVSTVLSTETVFGVLTTRGSVKGLIQNDIVHANDGLIRISYIEKEADIEEGDIVVTSGGDMYPANVIVGEVVEVFLDANGMYQQALIKPSEDVRRLTNVLVVTNFEGKQTITIGTDNE